MENVTRALQRERELLDQMRFRSAELRLLLAAGEVRYLPWATQEVINARRRACECDLVRATAVAALPVLGARGTPTLRELATLAPAPWAGMLRDHHEALCALVAQIELSGHRSAELARAAIHTLASDCEQGLVADLRADDDIADGPAPTVRVAPPDLAEVDPLAAESALAEVVAAASRLAMPALVAFLR